MPEKKSKDAASIEGLQKALDALVAQLSAFNARLEKLEAAGATLPVAVAAPAAEPAAEAAAAPMPEAQPLEAQPPVAQAAAVEPAPVQPDKAVDEFSEELLLALSAAVAAYLGKRPHIRAIRLLGSSAWAQQGRVFVQASHQLNVPHDA